MADDQTPTASASQRQRANQRYRRGVHDVALNANDRLALIQHFARKGRTPTNTQKPFRYLLPLVNTTRPHSVPAASTTQQSLPRTIAPTKPSTPFTFTTPLPNKISKAHSPSNPSPFPTARCS